MAALNKLLALLELGRHGGDPIDNPAPWSWSTWMEHFNVDRAPWSGPHWMAKTGVSRENWESSRAFVVAYHAAGDNPTQRHYFATSLTGGQLFAGLQLLLNKFEADGLQADVDMVIEAILESIGIKKLDELHVEILCERASVESIAWLLFGKDTFAEPSVPHPAVTIWILDILRETKARWIYIYNERVHTVESLQRDVYIACKAQDITAYLGALSSLVKQLNFTGHDEQLEHYRNLLRAMTDCVNRQQSPAPCIPPNTARALRNLPTVQHHEQVKTALLECWNIVNTVADRIPDSSSGAFDLYDRLCGQSLALSVGLGDYIDGEGADSPEWGGEKQTAFLFACHNAEWVNRTRPQSKGTHHDLTTFTHRRVLRYVHAYGPLDSAPAHVVLWLLDDYIFTRIAEVDKGLRESATVTSSIVLTFTWRHSPQHEPGPAESSDRATPRAGQDRSAGMLEHRRHGGRSHFRLFQSRRRPIRQMCSDLALTVGLGEGSMYLEDCIDEEGADSPEWGDEGQTAFSFAISTLRRRHECRVGKVVLYSRERTIRRPRPDPHIPFWEVRATFPTIRLSTIEMSHFTTA
ncbi:hypothetical protein LXA43DRAFT_1063074 [Ganoderma leucocontextum]|nr:hypothetical protein LXA43DRAFT_1063074 [Ganoderma leucocontextum]